LVPEYTDALAADTLAHSHLHFEERNWKSEDELM
jgi:hypothetical protein